MSEYKSNDKPFRYITLKERLEAMSNNMDIQDYIEMVDSQKQSDSYRIDEMANLGYLEKDKSSNLTAHVFADDHGKAHLHIKYGNSKGYKFHLDGTPDTSILRIPKEIENNIPKIKKYILDNKDALENAFDELVKSSDPDIDKKVKDNFERFKGKSKKEIKDIKAKENSNDKQEEKTCPYCKKKFTTSKDHKVYCCVDCREKYYEKEN